MTTETLSVAPTPKQIDALIDEFAKAQSVAMATAAIAKTDSAAAGEIKVRLTAMVEAHGFRHTEKSKRLIGLHNTATTTTATRVSVDDGAVEELRTYLGKQDIPQLSERFFVAHTTYSLVSGPQDVLKTLSLGKRIHEKISSLLGLCFQIKTNTPSLKIETVTPEKPAKAA